MFALGMILALLPLLLLLAVPVAAWREGRGSPWSFAVGRVISNAFSAIGGAPLACIAVSFLLHGLPGGLVGATTATTDIQADMIATRYASVYAGWGLVNLLVWPLGQLVLTLLALDTLAGRGVDVRRTFGRALRLWPFGIAVTLLAWIGIGIGLLVLIVPGLVLLLNWFVVLPVLAAEGATVLGSFERSAALVQGMRWRLLLLLLLAGVAWMFFLMLTGMLAGVVTVTVGGGGWPVGAVQVIGTTLSGLLVPVGVAAVYHEVRSAKEGQGSEDLAAVFA